MPRKAHVASARYPERDRTPIHDRTPVILPREAWSAWLGEEPTREDELRALLKPFPAERMRAYSVSAKVNSVKNDEPSLIEAAQSAD
jgi:putative SOS response-associated peptidase YedK